jgi:hypothetical protein
LKNLTRFGKPGLVQPGGEEALDVPAAARPLEPSADRVPFHDDERRQHTDREPLDQIGAFLLGDVKHLERSVIPSPLQHLGQEALHTAAVTRDRRVEENQPRLLVAKNSTQFAPP